MSETSTFGGKPIKAQRRPVRVGTGRTLPAEEVTVGMKLRGHATLTTYEVLAIEAVEKNYRTLVVLNCRSGDISRWRRRNTMHLELA